MFEIVKTQFGWTVREIETGEEWACESSLLSACAIKAHLETQPEADPELHAPEVMGVDWNF